MANERVSQLRTTCEEQSSTVGAIQQELDCSHAREAKHLKKIGQLESTLSILQLRCLYLEGSSESALQLKEPSDFQLSRTAPDAEALIQDHQSSSAEASTLSRCLRYINDDHFEAFVSLLSGTTISVLVHRVVLVGELKMLLSPRLGIPPFEQRLIYNEAIHCLSLLVYFLLFMPSREN